MSSHKSSNRHYLCTHNEGFTLHDNINKHVAKSSILDRRKATCGPTQSSKDPSIPTYPKTTFPIPLVLPGDALCDDFEADEKQTLMDWLTEGQRNSVTPERRTLYVGAAPRTGEEVKFLDDWKNPNASTAKRENIRAPKAEDVMRYLSAFYWPLPVKQLSMYEFVEWDDEPIRKKAKGIANKKGKSKMSPSPCIGLYDRISGGSTRISSRVAPPPSPYTHQLSVNDLIDAMMENLPSDAYAAVLLVEHDIYEDDEDDFIIGRAYGGSRVAVVSQARYNPALDTIHSVPRQHCWPLGRCVTHLQDMGLNIPESQIIKASSWKAKPDKPMLAAISFALDYEEGNSHDIEELSRLWLHRVCRTVSHELGHCFGLDHCLYYECIMQSTASVAEDTRQPSYLCPIDLAKLLEATSSPSKELERCEEVVLVCQSLGPGGGFGALEAWMKARIEELKGAL